MQRVMTDDLDALLGALPPHIAAPLRGREDKGLLLEIVMDLGRPPAARLTTGDIELSPSEVTEEDLMFVTERIGSFGDDNRAGIARTLHRISAIRNRRGKVVGLTCRVGRAIYGTVNIIDDLVQSGKSILMLGRPGVGKTTMLREVARVLSSDLLKRVIVVDTSNEIAGDGDIPHPAIGHARRMQVPSTDRQHAVMIEAVENHMPQVIIIDEIGTELEAAAARTIAERGVQLVGTAHGNTLENLIMNPTLSDLVGGIQSVTLGDEEARRRGTQKSILERKAPPTFDVVVEIMDWSQVAVHGDVAAVVDSILRGQEIAPEARVLTPEGQVKLERRAVAPEPSYGGTGLGQSNPAARRRPGERTSGGFREPRLLGIGTPGEPAPPTPLFGGAGGGMLSTPPAVVPSAAERRGSARVFPFGISRSRLEQAIRGMQLPITIQEKLESSDALVTLRNYYRRKPQLLRDAEARGVPLYVLKNHTLPQIEQALHNIWQSVGGGQGNDQVVQALHEAEEAAHMVMNSNDTVALNPQNAYIRRLQHEVATRYNLTSRSNGREPNRRVMISREINGTYNPLDEEAEV